MSEAKFIILTVVAFAITVYIVRFLGDVSFVFFIDWYRS